MSLYTLKEVCNGCEWATFHDCCGSFCKCKLNHEEEVDSCVGECIFKLEDTQEDNQPHLEE